MQVCNGEYHYKDKLKIEFSTVNIIKPLHGLPEQPFYMIGSIEEAEERADKKYLTT